MANRGNTGGVALVIGVTGINGSSISRKLLERGWKVYGSGLRPRPAWLPADVNYLQFDLLNREAVRGCLSPLSEVTHLFFAAWVLKENEEANCEANGSMLRNTLDALLSNTSSALQHVCLTTGTKHYIGPFDRFGKLLPPEPPFKEDMPRLPAPNFYYVQEDILFEAVKTRKQVSYSIHRPCTILGFAPRNYMNMLTALAVYACLCKREGAAFEFPGNLFAWERFTDVSDADLIAEQEIWAATDPRAKNEAFNITNGDVFKWKTLWQVIAEEMGVPAAPYSGKGFNLAERMKGKDEAWAAFVEENKLVKTTLEEVGQFWFVDAVFKGCGVFEAVSSMNKSKELGFLGFRDTEKSVRHWIQKFKAERIIP